MLCIVSFLHIWELNPEALTKETNSGSQKENCVITVCLCPMIVAGIRLVRALMCAVFPDVGNLGELLWWDRKEPDLCILPQKYHLFLYISLPVKMLASFAALV